MNNIITEGIIEVLDTHKDLLKIALRQKAKFEGWLKFELAYYLETKGMREVAVETAVAYRRDRRDITFFHNESFYTIELKTSNTNWKSDGIKNSTRPITMNIQSIIKDAFKLNSTQGIVAFILFPIPIKDRRWEAYIDRIVTETGIAICKSSNCRLLEMNIDDCNKCEILICTFMSKKF